MTNKIERINTILCDKKCKLFNSEASAGIKIVDKINEIIDHIQENKYPLNLSDGDKEWTIHEKYPLKRDNVPIVEDYVNEVQDKIATETENLVKAFMEQTGLPADKCELVVEIIPGGHKISVTAKGNWKPLKIEKEDIIVEDGVQPKMPRNLNGKENLEQQKPITDPLTKTSEQIIEYLKERIKHMERRLSNLYKDFKELIPEEEILTFKYDLELKRDICYETLSFILNESIMSLIENNHSKHNPGRNAKENNK